MVAISTLLFTRTKKCGDREKRIRNLSSICSRNELVGCETPLTQSLFIVAHTVVLDRFRLVFNSLDMMRRRFPAITRKTERIAK